GGSGGGAALIGKRPAGLGPVRGLRERRCRSPFVRSRGGRPSPRLGRRGVCAPGRNTRCPPVGGRSDSTARPSREGRAPVRLDRMNEPVIRVRGLRKGYGSTVAVDGLDLDVHEGETLAVLGPNGAGKSTMVQILSAQLGRDGGEVTVLGTDPARADRRFRSRLGIVSQTTGDLLELTVGEVVRHFAAYYPRPRDPERVIAEVGLTEQARWKIRRLSGGQRRRVDVALGVVGNPELLFLDEPTTGFD